MAAEQPPQPKRARSTSLLAQAQLQAALWERDLPRSPAVADREVALPFTKAAFAAMTPSESNDRLTALVSRESRIIYDHALDLANVLLSYGTSVGRAGGGARAARIERPYRGIPRHLEGSLQEL